MKKYLILGAALLAALALTACDKTENEPQVSDTLASETETETEVETTELEGLAFGSNSDGTCSVVGLGTYTDADVVIPAVAPNGDQVTGIGIDAFRDCANITSITIPDSVSSIGVRAFLNCSSLESISVAEGNPNYHVSGNCLIETASKTLIVGFHDSVIPTDGSVTSIGRYAFYGCSDLTSIVIPDGVTSISDYAFSGCSGLTSLTIPDGMTRIADYAFSGCSGLTSLTIPVSMTGIGIDAFANCSAITDIYYDGRVGDLIGIAPSGSNHWAGLDWSKVTKHCTNGT